MSDVDVLVTILIFQIILMIPLIVFMKLGGWPEGFYRIFRIKYFVYRYFDEDWDIVRIPVRWVKLKTHSPTYFDYGGRRFYIDDNNTLRSKGRPSWLFTRTNAFALPIRTLNKSRPSVDAEAIRKAFYSQQLQTYLKARQGKEIKQGIPWRIIIIGISLLVFIWFLVSAHVI